MSRSVRHQPVVGYGNSEKANKVALHRTLRRKVQHVLRVQPEVEVLPVASEVSNVRDWAKDPRHWSCGLFEHVPELQRK